jgi:hypothetical protein
MRPPRPPQQAPVLRRSLPCVDFTCVSLPNGTAESGFSNSTRSAPRSVSRVRKPSHRGWGLLDLHAQVERRAALGAARDVLRVGDAALVGVEVGHEAERAGRTDLGPEPVPAALAVGECHDREASTLAGAFPVPKCADRPNVDKVGPKGAQTGAMRDPASVPRERDWGEVRGTNPQRTRVRSPRSGLRHLVVAGPPDSAGPLALRVGPGSPPRRPRRCPPWWPRRR